MDVVRWLTERQGNIEEALRQWGNADPKSMAQEDVITWLKFRAQLSLIIEMLEEARKGNIKLINEPYSEPQIRRQ